MHIALYHNLPSGGARHAMVKMVEGLVSRGHMVDEYCPETADQTFLPLDGTVRRTVVLPFEPFGVSDRRIPLLTPYVTTARLSRDLRALSLVGQNAAQSINQDNYDLVFSHDCQFILVPDVLRYLRIPGIHYFHVGTRGLDLDKKRRDSSTGLSARLKRAYYSPAYRYFSWLRQSQSQQNFQAARRILTNSLFSRDELQRAYNMMAKVCYLGVDVVQFRPLGLPRDRFVLSVGAVHFYKGYRFLIQSLVKLPENQRPPLIIAANNSEPAEMQILRKLATDSQVNLSVRRVTDQNEMMELYNRASAFVYSPIREPWGLAAVEAMACGTPVVAVGEGGVAESVVDGETGLLTTRNEELFAGALNRVLSDPGLAARLGEGGVTRVRSHFTWAKTVDRLETQFHELVHEHNAS